MKHYLVEFGVYENCHIVEEREIEFDANDDEEAQDKASFLANSIEAEGSKLAPESEWWACIEELREVR